MSRAANTTAANIRHHLSILTNEGVVEVVGERPTYKRGRPALLYALSKQARQHNLDGLSNALLDELLLPLQSSERWDALKRISRRMVGEVESSANLTQRLYLPMRRLKEMQYNARWEAHPNAPRIILGHCPFAQILPEHPELCQVDGLIIEKLLGKRVQQVEKLAIDYQGSPYCRFIVRHE
jgi:predicted ArsR family transcriptional regulator